MSDTRSQIKLNEGIMRLNKYLKEVTGADQVEVNRRKQLMESKMSMIADKQEIKQLARQQSKLDYKALSKMGKFKRMDTIKMQSVKEAQAEDSTEELDRLFIDPDDGWFETLNDTKIKSQMIAIDIK